MADTTWRLTSSIESCASNAKWARKRGEVVQIHLATSRHTPLNGYIRSKYEADEIDAIAAYCGDLDQCYLFPIEELAGRSAIFLRLKPAKTINRRR